MIRRSWLRELLAGCAGLLLCALGLYVAVRLVEAVWVPLAVIGGAVLVLGACIVIYRRRRGW